jgi:hypothetical protein
MGAIDIYTRLLDPLHECFTPALARRLRDLRADPGLRRQIQDLAEKCNEGSLTADERVQYESIAHAIQFMTALQSKARRFLKARRSKQ